MILRITPTIVGIKIGSDISATAYLRLFQVDCIHRLSPHLLPLQSIYLLSALDVPSVYTVGHPILFVMCARRQTRDISLPTLGVFLLYPSNLGG